MRIFQNSILKRLEKEYPYQIVFDLSILDKDEYDKTHYARTFDEAYEFAVSQCFFRSEYNIYSLEEARVTSIVWEAKSMNNFTSCFIKKNAGIESEWKDWNLSIFSDEILILLFNIKKKGNLIHLQEVDFMKVTFDWFPGRYRLNSFSEIKNLSLKGVIDNFFSYSKVKPKNSDYLVSQIIKGRTGFTDQYFQKNPNNLFVEMHVLYDQPKIRQLC